MPADTSKPVPTFPFDTENPSGVPGATDIYEDVIAAIAGHVAAEVEGVVSIGTGGVLRALAGVVQDTAEQKATGVEVEAGQREAIFDLELVVEYGHSIPDIVQQVRENVATEVKKQLGLVAKEINLSITGIEFPAEIPSGRVE